ncbi:hypothetical protein Tco_0230902, partial [Tanacetum coccineum]
MNNQLRTSSNTRNQATIQDGRVVVQNVQGRQNLNQNQRYFARGNGAAGNGGTHNRAGNANAGQDAANASPREWCILDEEELLFLAGEYAKTFDADVDNQPVQDLALNKDNIFQADKCDAFNSDVDDEPNAHVTNQEEHEIHNEVQQENVIESTSVDMSNSNVIPYEQYLSVDNISVVPSYASS